MSQRVEQQILKFVSGVWYKIRVFNLFDRERQTYAILALPDDDYPISGVRNRIELLVHLKDDYIIVEIDLSDKP